MWALFDGSYFLHRALHVESYAMMESEGVPTGGILGVLNEIRKCLSDLNPSHAVIVWDSGLSIRRYNIYPEYKQKEKPTTINSIRESRVYHRNYETQKHVLNKILPTFGIRSILTLPNVPQTFEGDDLLYNLSKITQDDMEDRSVIVSDDKDLLQCVDHKISVYRPIANQHFYEDNFSSTGCAAVGNYLLRRSVIGDSSDNIDGVPGAGEKTADDALSDGPIYFLCGSHLSMVDTFTKHCLESTIKRVRKLAEYSSYMRILRNLQLMDLRVEAMPKRAISAMRSLLKKKSKLNIKASKEVCKTYAFQSLLDRYNIWLTPFRKLR